MKTLKSRMPNFYRPMWPGAPAELQGPLRWQDDVTGELPRAVLAFFEHGMDRRVILTAEQIELVRDYIAYYIDAPCWKTGDPEGVYASDFAALRERIQLPQTFETLSAWLWDALNVGIDPL